MPTAKDKNLAAGKPAHLLAVQIVRAVGLQTVLSYWLCPIKLPYDHRNHGRGDKLSGRICRFRGRGLFERGASRAHAGRRGRRGGGCSRMEEASLSIAGWRLF